MLKLAYDAFTLPGIFVHVSAHRRACEYHGLAVRNYHYLESDHSGYVESELPKSVSGALSVAAAPFVANTLLAVVAYLGVAMLFIVGGSPIVVLPLVTLLGWLGFSAGLHAFPHSDVARDLWHEARESWRENPLVVLAFPLVIAAFLMNIFQRTIFLNAAYAIGLGFGVVLLVISLV